MCQPRTSSDPFAPPPCHRKEPGRCTCRGCREVGCLGTAPVCLSVSGSRRDWSSLYRCVHPVHTGRWGRGQQGVGNWPPGLLQRPWAQGTVCLPGTWPGAGVPRRRLLSLTQPRTSRHLVHRVPTGQLVVGLWKSPLAPCHRRGTWPSSRTCPHPRHLGGGIRRLLSTLCVPGRTPLPTLTFQVAQAPWKALLV